VRSAVARKGPPLARACKDWPDAPADLGQLRGARDGYRALSLQYRSVKHDGRHGPPNVATARPTYDITAAGDGAPPFSDCQLAEVRRANGGGR